jgi:deoxycytidine triphosphate deaminase
MIRAPISLLDSIRKGNLILHLSQRELSNPEGIGFDLSVSQIFLISEGTGSLKRDTRRTPNAIEVREDSNGCYILEPGEVYLVSTVEEFDLPSDLTAFFYPRSTLFRSGINFSSSVLPPGYVGPLTFSLTNNFKNPFEIEKGARFAHVVFHSVSGEVNSYKGQWQGGRTSQPKNEEQI